MAVEKIAFVFPTLMRPGMAVDGIYRPEISMHLNCKGEKYLMAITVGVMFNSAGNYFTEVDINHSDDLHTSDEVTDGWAEYLYGEKVGDDQQVSIYSMLASSVNLDKEGVYRVIIRIFKSEHGVKVGEPVTMGECYFYVSHAKEHA